MPQGFVAVQLDQPLELEASMWITCGISLLSQHSTQYAAEKLKPATPDSVGIGIDDMSGDPLNVWQQALVDDDCNRSLRCPQHNRLALQRLDLANQDPSPDERQLNIVIVVVNIMESYLIIHWKWGVPDFIGIIYR